MKRTISLVLLACLLLCTLVPAAANAAEPRIRVITPGLEIDGNIAYCDLSVNCDYSTDTIRATIRLWKDNAVITTWYRSATGYLAFQDTCTVIPGHTYKLTADVTINGYTYPTVTATP